jgi:hypothetical protein
MSDAPERANENTNFVEHLRLIHFTLLAACLAALIAITSTAPSYLARSAEETRRLRMLSEKWQGGDWLQKVIVDKKSEMTQSAAAVLPKDALRYKDPSAFTILIRFPVPGDQPGAARFSDGGSQSWLLLATGLGNNGHALTSHEMSFKTVADAQAVWNTHDRYRYIATLSKVGEGWYITAGGVSTDLKFDTPNKTGPLQHLYLFLRDDIRDHLASRRSEMSNAALRNINNDSSNCYLYASDKQQGLYVLRAECASQIIDLQAFFVKTLPPRSLLVENFPSRFRMLKS